MIPWIELDRVPTPSGNGELSLHRRGAEYSIRIGYDELMNSRVHGSEEALASLAFAALARRNVRVLVGGLGMGFTLAAAIAEAGPQAAIEVVELSSAVVEWNRGELGECAGRPLDDPRVSVTIADVCRALRSSPEPYDAILLDVDNGPDGLTESGNDWLYSERGLAATLQATNPGGVVCYWSAGPDERFTRRLQRAGFSVDVERVRARGKRGAKHTIWVARRPAGQGRRVR